MILTRDTGYIIIIFWLNMFDRVWGVIMQWLFDSFFLFSCNESASYFYCGFKNLCNSDSE